ncbi:serine hydrolase domain-containing protein [Ornithinibacillus halophilus]|uniref:CubicO group peptidase, beta-lactamase class C family n=1 Tax=Ornithinibacillus halophilus TaxID=930117 RepID=A0A1M5K1M7_9BACI|nr:serine hydrolase domain-containing protein [Ornithinibacillus halophilus]SHG46698.1 CubicO group peptidase, beta-lactamase class C family [Ornithinibacillus halophilus]
MREKVLDLLHKEIEAEHIPGAVLTVSYQGETVLEEVVGYKTIFPEKTPMNVDTVFDLASLTKVVATLPSMLKLIEEGEIRLDDPVAHFLPEFEKQGKEQITLRHLLTHTSGLPAHKQYYKENMSTEEILTSIYQQELEYKTDSQVVYSDLGLITLYKVIETVTSQQYSDFLEQQFFKPLEMHETGFNPSYDDERYAATEFDEKTNSYKLGIVHDDNTESMGGISGHAGLFSTLHDLQNYASMIENNGVYKGRRILSEATLELSRRNYTAFDKEHRGLGWILKSPTHSSCGDLFSDLSYGHTGFTGTSIWFDPTIDLNVILLTNRVHFGRHPHILRLRPRLHNIIRSYF